jgi:hypothetical protein
MMAGNFVSGLQKVQKGPETLPLSGCKWLQIEDEKVPNQIRDLLGSFGSHRRGGMSNRQKRRDSSLSSAQKCPRMTRFHMIPHVTGPPSKSNGELAKAADNSLLMGTFFK